jgi:hypothetical protein
MSDEEIATAIALILKNRIEEMVEYTEKKKKIIKAIPDVSTPVQEKIEQSLNATPARSAETIDKMFEDLHKLVTLVARGSLKSLIAIGSGGVGKCLTGSTYTKINASPELITIMEQLNIPFERL